MSSRQAWIVGIGVAIAIGLAAFAASDPGCDSYHQSTGACLQKVDYGYAPSTSQAPFFWIAAVGVLVVAVLLAVSPWGRKQS